VPELSSEIWALLTQDIPELRGDQIVEKLLDASIEENVATLLHVFEHGLVPDEIRAPPAAVEYARRLAQRGVSTIALVRSLPGWSRPIPVPLYRATRQAGPPMPP
jgi:hypothetical protein